MKLVTLRVMQYLSFEARLEMFTLIEAMDDLNPLG